MKRKYLWSLFLSLIITTQTYAMCPVCTIAAAAGVELSHYLGIDDTITGIWIGGMLVSVSMWTIDWFDRKKIRFFLKRKLTYVFYYTSVIYPLYYGKLMFLNPANILWGVDKLLLGMIVGTFLFYFSARYYLYLKEKNNGRAYFPMQKVAMSVGSLGVASIIFYYITTFIYAI